MELGGRDTLLTIGTAVLWVAGIALVIFGDFLLTVTGIVAITVSSLVLLVDAKDLLVREDEQHAGE